MKVELRLRMVPPLLSGPVLSSPVLSFAWFRSNFSRNSLKARAHALPPFRCAHARAHKHDARDPWERYGNKFLCVKAQSHQRRAHLLEVGLLLLLLSTTFFFSFFQLLLLLLFFMSLQSLSLFAPLLSLKFSPLSRQAPRCLAPTWTAERKKTLSGLWESELSIYLSIPRVHGEEAEPERDSF